MGGLIQGGGVIRRTAPRSIISETGGAQSPLVSPDFSSQLNITVALSANLVVTGTTGLGNETGYIYYTVNGHSLTVLGKTGFILRSGVAGVSITNRGSEISPDYEVTDLYAIDSLGITGGGSESPSTTLDCSVDVATITLSANLTITSVINISTGAAVKRKFILNGFILVILGITITANADDEASVSFQNWGTYASPDIEVIDNYGGSGTGELMKSFQWTSAQILQAFTTPTEILPVPPSGKAYRVTHYDFMLKSYGGVAYTTNLGFWIGESSGSNFSGTISNMLGSAAGVHRAYYPTSGYVITNTAIKVGVNVGNPVAGNSDFYIYIWYILVDL